MFFKLFRTLDPFRTFLVTNTWGKHQNGKLWTPPKHPGNGWPSDGQRAEQELQDVLWRHCANRGSLVLVKVHTTCQTSAWYPYFVKPWKANPGPQFWFLFRIFCFKSWDNSLESRIWTWSQGTSSCATGAAVTNFRAKTDYRRGTKFCTWQNNDWFNPKSRWCSFVVISFFWSTQAWFNLRRCSTESILLVSRFLADVPRIFTSAQGSRCLS